MTAPPGAPAYDAGLASRLGAALAAKGAGYVPRTHHLVGTAPKYTNRLILETSPYLLQHAHNPVDWRPWGDEAFAEAKRLHRPVGIVLTSELRGREREEVLSQAQPL